MKPWYLAGPMTGIPQFNFPTFDRVATELRNDGWNIMSPTELDTDAWRAAAMASPDGDLATAVGLAHQTWGEIMGRDVRHVADDCCGVILLPGWERSRGARLEAFVAVTCGKELRTYGPDGMSAVRKSWVLEMIRVAMEGP